MCEKRVAVRWLTSHFISCPVSIWTGAKQRVVRGWIWADNLFGSRYVSRSGWISIKLPPSSQFNFTALSSLPSPSLLSPRLCSPGLASQRESTTMSPTAHLFCPMSLAFVPCCRHRPHVAHRRLWRPSRNLAYNLLIFDNTLPTLS